MRYMIYIFLIYPYWNVNFIFTNYKNEYHKFLIYPYWNVNTNNKEKSEKRRGISNLSILECKYHN